MEPIIEIKGITKTYRLGENQNAYSTIRDLFRIKRNNGKSYKRDKIKALDDISFNIDSGESIGIIGKNGAGKSTLLKVLSRITTPTSGKILLRGRVASLLEVGTGFHAELTGRENIFFNGSILGLKRREILSKFDQMVDFAGVEEFIDTPLKHYSSGMQLRLAFAVAAHLEPEIMIIDEVLAVGDAEFQKKSIGKMDEVSKSGRTVLFVSHNLGLISQLCSKTAVLNSGVLHYFGPTEKAIEEYLGLVSDSEQGFRTEFISKEQPAQVLSYSLISSDRISKSELLFNEPFLMGAEVLVNRPVNDLTLAFVIFNSYKTKVFTLLKNIDTLNTGKYYTEVEIINNILAPGKYTISSYIYVPNVNVYETISEGTSFQIIDNGTEFTRYQTGEYGCVIVEPVWNFDKTD